MKMKMSLSLQVPIFSEVNMQIENSGQAMKKNNAAEHQNYKSNTRH